MKKTLYLLAILSYTLTVAQTNDCKNNTFLPTPGEQYVLQAWVKDDVATIPSSYQGHIEIKNVDSSGNYLATILFSGQGAIIDGWQRIEGLFTIPADIAQFQFELVAMTNGSSFFDDIRIFPINGNMKSFVYDPATQRLMAELDENNYATLYEYDKEGGLVRVKKETERGVYTIQETRSGNSTLNSQ